MSCFLGEAWLLEDSGCFTSTREAAVVVRLLAPKDGHVLTPRMVSLFS